MIDIVPGALEVEWCDETYGGVILELTLDIHGYRPCNNVQVLLKGLLPVIAEVYPSEYTDEVIDWLWVDNDGRKVLERYAQEVEIYNNVVKNVQLPRKASYKGGRTLLYCMSIYSQSDVSYYVEPVRLFIEVLVGSLRSPALLGADIPPTVSIAICTSTLGGWRGEVHTLDRPAGNDSGHEEGTLVQLGTYPLDVYPITVDSLTEVVVPVMSTYCKGAASILQVLEDKGLQLGD